MQILILFNLSKKCLELEFLFHISYLLNAISFAFKYLWFM